MSTGANLAALIAQSIREAGLEVKDKDIFVVAHKIVSKAEGQVLKLEDIEPSSRPNAGPGTTVKMPGWSR